MTLTALVNIIGFALFGLASLGGAIAYYLSYRRARTESERYFRPPKEGSPGLRLPKTYFVGCLVLVSVMCFIAAVYDTPAGQHPGMVNAACRILIVLDAIAYLGLGVWFAVFSVRQLLSQDQPPTER